MSEKWLVPVKAGLLDSRCPWTVDRRSFQTPSLFSRVSHPVRFAHFLVHSKEPWGGKLETGVREESIRRQQVETTMQLSGQA